MTNDTTSPRAFPGPDEVDGFWSFDKMHAPRPITPLSQRVILPTLSEAEYDSPVIVLEQVVNYYYYASFRPHPDPAVVNDRLTRYKATLAAKFPTVGPRWEHEWKPPLVAKVEEHKTADWAALSDAELSAKFDWFVEHQRHQWYVHGHINFALLAAAAFCDYYDALVHPTDRTESYLCLQGHRTRTVDATVGLWRLSRAVRADAGLLATFRATPPTELPAVLASSPAGRAFLADLAAYLTEFGWRSDAVYDMADVTWREDPSIPLTALGGFIDLGDGDDPERHLARSAARRDELVAAARAKLAGDIEQLAHFDELFAAASFNLPLTEDHAFWIDQSGIAVFRRFVLEIGGRLVARGLLDAAEDVHYLFPDELKAALGQGTDHRGAAHRRRIEMAECAAVVPPPVLGNPPPPPPEPDPFMDAVVVRLLGVTPPGGNTDPLLLTGVGAAKGKVTGRARVVRSLSLASDVDEGDIVVCEMTLPPWVPLFSIAAAFVTDTGGVLSHCAIVAREFGIPAVCGTQVGTTVIQDGQTITVDGDAGTVRIHG